MKLRHAIILWGKMRNMYYPYYGDMHEAYKFMVDWCGGVSATGYEGPCNTVLPWYEYNPHQTMIAELLDVSIVDVHREFKLLIAEGVL